MKYIPVEMIEIFTKNSFVLWFLMVFFLCFGQSLIAQEENLLLNPSFEGSKAKMGQVPLHWHDEGYAGASPPDVHSAKSKMFGVSTQPIHGDYFLGMVVRSNGTNEALGQKLAKPLQKDTIYTFNVYLTRSDFYYSLDQLTQKGAHFNTPIRLRIWARNAQKQAFFLGQTPLIEHLNWEKYAFQFKAEDDFVEIVLEAYYAVSKEEAYNGNILLDGCELTKKKE